MNVIDRLAACVALPSPTPPGRVAEVAGWVDAWATGFGASVTRQHVTAEADNVLAALRFGDGPRLVFNSHLDVVDPSTQDWATSPYKPVVRDGRMIGRGTCDAKGSLVAMLAAMERLAAAPRGLAGEVLLTAVMGEEAGGLGSAHLVAQGLRADAAVVGEPTGLAVARAHKGTYMTGGEIITGGRDLLTLPEREMRRVRGNDIAMVFQDPMTSLNPRPSARRSSSRCASTGRCRAERRGYGRWRPCGRSASPTRRGGRVSTRTSSPAACGSAR
jgi:hypothetical protein